MQVTVASAPRYLYFLFEVIDTLFLADDGRQRFRRDELRCGGPLPEQNTPAPVFSRKAAVRDHAFPVRGWKDG